MPESATIKTVDTLLLDLAQDVSVVLTQNSAILNEQGEARISRRLMHEKLEKIQKEVYELQEAIKNIEPIVKQHEEDWQSIRMGKALIAFVWSVVLLSAGFAASLTWEYVKRHWK